MKLTILWLAIAFIITNDLIVLKLAGHNITLLQICLPAIITLFAVVICMILLMWGIWEMDKGEKFYQVGE